MVVEADRIVLEGGVIRGEGHVLVQLGDTRITAETLTFDGETLSGTGVSYTNCGCVELPPWRVTAAEAEWVPDETVRVRRAMLRLLDVPVLPIPAGTIPLKRRSGLLLPTVSHGVDGWRFAQPFYLTVGRSADLTLTPEVRTKRSVRLLGEARYALRGGSGSLTGALGHDYAERRPRGAAAWTHGWSDGTLLTATRGQWAGDPTYFADYGDRFLDRGHPYDEARILLGAGQVEIGTDVFQSVEPTDHLVAELGVYQPSGPIPAGFLGAASVRAGYWVHGETPWGGTDGFLTVASETRLERPMQAGPVRLSALARARVTADAVGGLLHAEAGMDARLPAWHQGTRGLSHLEPQLRVLYAGSTTLGEVSPDVLPPRWTASPSLLYRHSGRRGLVEARTGVALTSSGWQIDLGGHARTGPWNGWLQGRGGPEGLDLGSAGIHWAQARGSVEVAWSYSPERLLYQPDPDDVRSLHQLRGGARWTLPGPLHTLALSASSTWDLERSQWLHRGGGVRWTHPTGCLALGMEAWLDDDRPIPDVALTLAVRP
ncbi:MAG: LPS-assembly protein LptD [Deltaproteobacteria bacterium]|nr:LPS-assembly protein LptD [Deltaproteobacteria bacterium]